MSQHVYLIFFPCYFELCVCELSGREVGKIVGSIFSPGENLTYLRPLRLKKNVLKRVYYQRWDMGSLMVYLTFYQGTPCLHLGNIEIKTLVETIGKVEAFSIKHDNSPSEILIGEYTSISIGLPLDQNYLQ